MLSIYTKLSSHLLTLRERESCSKHLWNWFYFSKVENSSYHQELVSHPMPVCWWIEKFSQHNTPGTFPWQLLTTQVLCGAKLFSSSLTTPAYPWQVFQDNHFLSVVSVNHPCPLQLMKVWRICTRYGPAWHTKFSVSLSSEGLLCSPIKLPFFPPYGS